MNNSRTNWQFVEATQLEALLDEHQTHVASYQAAKQKRADLEAQVAEIDANPKSFDDPEAVHRALCLSQKLRFLNSVTLPFENEIKMTDATIESCITALVGGVNGILIKVKSLRLEKLCQGMMSYCTKAGFFQSGGFQELWATTSALAELDDLQRTLAAVGLQSARPPIQRAKAILSIAENVPTS